MHYVLIITEDAIEEMKALKESDPVCHAAALELLLQIEESQALMDDLMIEHLDDEDDPIFEVKKLKSGQRKNANLFILKFHTLRGALATHRIIYGFHSQAGKYYVLHISNRGDNYDRTEGWLEEILGRYDRAGIPRYKRS